MTKPVLAIETEFGRRYVHPITGEMVPSVTTVTGAGITKDLADWGAKQAAQWVIDNRSTLHSYDDEKLFNLMVNAHKNTRDKASGKGDVVHESAEKWAQGGDDGNSPKHMKQLKRFLEVSRFRITHTEVTLWNSDQGYAGTCDVIAQDRNGRAVLIDYKSGNQVYNEAAIQLEALSRCARVVNPDGTEVPIPLINTVGVLHLRPLSWWWHPIQDRVARGRNWTAFLACLDVFKSQEPIREWKTFHPNMVWGNLGRFNEANWP